MWAGPGRKQRRPGLNIYLKSQKNHVWNIWFASLNFLFFAKHIMYNAYAQLKNDGHSKNGLHFVKTKANTIAITEVLN